MRPEYLWWQNGVMVRVLRKCASESMRAVLYPAPNSDFACDKFLTYRIMLAFIRDPVERLISGFRFFKDKTIDALRADTYEAYVDRALTSEDDHWCSQTFLLRLGIWPTHIYRFEELPQIWRDWGLPELSVMNSSKPLEVDSGYRLGEIRRAYAEDYALRG